MFEFFAFLAFLIVVLAIFHNDKALAHKSIDTLGKMVISSKQSEAEQEEQQAPARP